MTDKSHRLMAPQARKITFSVLDQLLSLIRHRVRERGRSHVPNNISSEKRMSPKKGNILLLEKEGLLTAFRLSKNRELVLMINKSSLQFVGGKVKPEKEIPVENISPYVLLLFFFTLFTKCKQL